VGTHLRQLAWTDGPDSTPAPPWRQDGRTLVREWRFRDFDGALRFVEQVAREAVDYLRRPDMCIDEFNHVRITIANLHNADLTEAEHRLAAKVDAVIARHHPDAVRTW
jgi:pterin-4a-carbinolamine dehydratase